MITTQRDLKKEIFKIKESMSDETLFSSHAYLDYQNKVMEGCTKQYGMPNGRVYFDNMNPDEQAYTDGRDVHINLVIDLLHSLSRREKDLFYTALNLHECGHILFTDFSLDKTTREKLHENTLYPLPEASTERDECLSWLICNSAGKMVERLYHALDNCIEDGHIEKRIMAAVPGYGASLKFAREIDLSQMESVSEMRDKGLDDIAIIINMILRYAKFRQTSFGNTPPDDPAIQDFLSIRPFVDKAVDTNNSIFRKKAVNECFVRMFHLIADKLDQQKKDSDKSQGKENTPPNTQDGKGNLPSRDEYSSGMENGPSKEQFEQVINGLSDMLDNMGDQTTHGNTKILTPVLTSESSAVDNGAQAGCTASSSLPSGNMPSSALGNNLETIETKAAQEVIGTNQEKDLIKELKHSLTEVSHDNAIHRGIPFSVTRADISKEGAALYEAEHSILDAIARKVMKNLLKELEDRRRGDSLNGLYMGRRLDTPHAYRLDQKIFRKNILPENVPNMAIEVLVDCSGSMSGKRILYARKCAYITWKFCQMAGIPVGVTGHNTNGSKVEIKSYADPYSLDGKDGIRIFSMNTDGSNRDGFAVRHCLKRLRKSDADQKILFIICDGKPNHLGYGKAEGKADLQDAVAIAKKEGILTVVAAIGDDTNSVKYIYTDGITEKKSAMFLEISDLERLPKTFVKLIKRHLE